MSRKLEKVYSPRPRQLDQENQGGKEEAPHDSLVTCERHVPCLLQSTFSSESNILSCLCWSHVLSNDDGGTKFFNSTGRHLFVPLQHSLTIYVTKTWAQPIVVVQVALKGKQLDAKYKNRRSSWFVTTRPLSLKISLIFQSFGAERQE